MAITVGTTITTSAAAFAIVTLAHSLDAGTVEVLLGITIRGATFQATSAQWNPNNADPTQALTKIREDINPSTLEMVTQWWKLTAPQSISGGDMEMTYGGAPGTCAVIVLNLISTATPLSQITDGAGGTSVGSLSKAITAPTTGVILSLCGMRTAASETCDEDVSQTQRMDLLAAANGLRAVATTEVGSGSSDTQTFTFSNSTRNAALSVVAYSEFGADRRFLLCR